jgi:hypothetical protein
MPEKMSADLRDALRANALDSIYWPKKAGTIIEKDLPTFYHAAADVIGLNEPILYLEFGVAHGKSMLEVTRIFEHPDARFFGFDSFVGLPQDWLMHKKGAFSNLGHPPVLEDVRVNFIQGWFQNSLPGSVERLARLPRQRVLVHFDADLYSSTLFILTQLWNFFEDYFFIFDDFIYDEVVALHDFIGAFPNEIEFILQTRGGGPGPNPDQVFGRIWRREFQP